MGRAQRLLDWRSWPRACTPEQIHRQAPGGRPAASRGRGRDVVKQLKISGATHHRWRASTRTPENASVTVNQGSALPPPNAPRKRNLSGRETRDPQKPWSELVKWAREELNLRPLPCQQNPRNRCARSRSPRSPPAVEAEGKRSLDIQLNALLRHF
jgi:hypothetical protein